MNSWHDKAQEEIQKDHDDGLMTDSEYQIAMRDLDREFRDYAQEETEHYFDSLMVRGY